MAFLVVSGHIWEDLGISEGVGAYLDMWRYLGIWVDFQVAAVKKPLISVKRICEKGNKVCFGPEEKDNFVVNTKTNKKVLLRPNGKGSYLLDAKFKGGENISVVVDSGAEENVCPEWWGKQFGMSKPKAWLNFSGANGAKIHHYGKRSIIMESTF